MPTSSLPSSKSLTTTGSVSRTSLYTDSWLTGVGGQALIEGPTTGVPRQPFSYRRLTLTPYVIKFPRGAGTTKVKKTFEESGVVEKWEKSAWAQKRASSEKRKNLTDFERFQVMLLKKQRRRIVDVR